jgi:Flp pilus assembly pilin Flp
MDDNHSHRTSDAMVAVWVFVEHHLTSLRHRVNERGATSIEYALMASLIAVAIIGSVSFFMHRVGNMYNTASNTIP